MRMSRVEDPGVPSYRRHRASGQAVVTLNGVDFYLRKMEHSQSQLSTIECSMSGSFEVADSGRRVTPGGDARQGTDVGYHAFVSAEMPDEVNRVKLALRTSSGALRGNRPRRSSARLLIRPCEPRMVDDGLCASTIAMRTRGHQEDDGWGVSNEILPGDALYRLQAAAPL